MGFDVGCAGVFGVMLDAEKVPALAPLMARLSELMSEGANDPEGTAEGIECDHDLAEQASRALTAAGIVVPERGRFPPMLLWTGRDHMNRSATEEERWVLGWGLFTQPWHYPPMEESFRRAANFHTWVWGG